MLIIFIIWLFLTPIKVSHDTYMSDEDVRSLMTFDYIFMAGRILDLFVSFYNPNGLVEHKLHAVILNNISTNLFLEFAISIVPLLMHLKNPLPSFYFAVFKLLRYGRLYEMDTNIATIIE